MTPLTVVVADDSLFCGQDREQDPVVAAMKEAGGMPACLPKGRGRTTFAVLERPAARLARRRKLAGMRE